MTFTSLGNAKASILVAVMRKFILLIPLIYTMPLLLSADKTTAVYMAEPVADFLAVTFTSVLFAFQFKKSLKQIADKPEKQEIQSKRKAGDLSINTASLYEKEEEI